jgi:hypothetical protein
MKYQGDDICDETPVVPTSLLALGIGCAALLAAATGCSPVPLRPSDSESAAGDSAGPVTFADAGTGHASAPVLADDGDGRVRDSAANTMTDAAAGYDASVDGVDGGQDISATDAWLSPEDARSQLDATPPRDTAPPPRDTAPPPRDTAPPPRDTAPPPRDTAPPPRDTAPPPRDAPLVVPRCAPVPLHYYYRRTETNADSYYVLGDFPRAAELGYTYQGIMACVCSGPAEDTAGLDGYWNGAITDHLYAIEHFLNAAKLGYTYRGTTGYVYREPTPGTIPLMRFWSRTLQDHHSTVGSPPSGSDYDYEKTTGYVLPASSCSSGN